MVDWIEYAYLYTAEKDAKLKAERGIRFGDVIKRIKRGFLIDVFPHPAPSHKEQEMMAINVDGYVYLVPCLIDHDRRTVSMRTIYPSRKATRTYRGKL